MCDRIESRPLFFVSWTAFLLSSLLQLWARHNPSFHPDIVDGLHGLFLGIFFGGIAVMMWRSRRRPSSGTR